MNKATVLILLSALIIGVFPSTAMCQSTNASEASSQSQVPQGWEKEFQDVCSKTQDSMILKQDELKALIARCDALKPKIEKLDETRRKVYLKRLDQCRGLYAYVLESKQSEKK